MFAAGRSFIERMPLDSHSDFDHAVMDLIEHNPGGVVPMTPSYQDALARLYAAHQIYANADHKNGHVTARSLARLPCFQAGNLAALLAGEIAPATLESNTGIFDRYVRSLAPAVREKAEYFRATIAGRPAHHRKHGDAARTITQDPLHTLFLVPGSGPHPGLPGNYLYGSVLQLSADPAAGWSVHIHDSDDGAASADAPTMADAFAKLQELIESAPFTLQEIEALGFKMS